MEKPSKRGKRKAMSLPELTDRLIRDPEAAKKLRLADSYMLQLQRVGREFRLPEEHSILLPIIEQYAKSLSKFVTYVKSLRDTTPDRGNTYVALHELYRMLEVRMVQQQRRERARRAMDWLEKKYPKMAFEQKRKWLQKLEQQWGRERMATMDIARRKTTTGRLSTEEREEVLAEFWIEIDERIERGDFPTP